MSATSTCSGSCSPRPRPSRSSPGAARRSRCSLSRSGERGAQRRRLHRRPPFGPTVALFLLALAPDEIRPRTSATAATVAASSWCTSPQSATRRRLPDHPDPLRRRRLGRRLGARRPRPPAARAARRARAAPSERSGTRSASAGSRRPRSARGSPATCTTRPDTRSTSSSSRQGAARLLRSRDPAAVAGGAGDDRGGRARDARRDRPARGALREDDGPRSERQRRASARPRRPGRRSSTATAPRAWRSSSPLTVTRRPLAPGVDQAAYRILQEALTNAARHGDGLRRGRHRLRRTTRSS